MFPFAHFDKKLYANPTYREKENFIDRLVRHQVGVTAEPENKVTAVAADNMLNRFTNDLIDIAQQGGLTMSNQNLTDSLIAFAMQMYYDKDNPNSTDKNKRLFNYDGVTGGIHFNRSDIASTLEGDAEGENGVDGYKLYFQKYLSKLPGNETGIITNAMPGLLDWYIQAGTSPMNAAAGIQAAFMLGGTGADNLTGGSCNDLLYGGTGADNLTGGGGNDTLIGGTGDDILDGGTGHDVYRYTIGDGNDIIFDSDRDGEIDIYGTNGKQISLGDFYKNEQGEWISPDNSNIKVVGKVLYLYDGSTINLGANFEDGDYGINLIPIPVTPTDPDAYHSITGDFAPIDFDPDTEGIQTDKDEWGNIITDPDKPEPGRADALHDTPANDLLNGGKGNDFIVSGNGGNDWLAGGEGNDQITANDDVNTVVIEGGAGTDVIYGGSGNDKIFCHDCRYSELEEILQMKHLIADGETAESIDIRGDVASGGVYRPYGEEQILDGDDYIYGSNASDVLLGGTGKDLLVGGGGDDVILGDKALAYVDYDVNWTFNIVDYGVSFENMGLYAPWPDDVKYALQDDDVIYAGTGNDYVYSMDNARGNNVAYVRNIIPFRQKIKHQKHQNTWRRISEEENLRRVAA